MGNIDSNKRPLGKIKNHMKTHLFVVSRGLLASAFVFMALAAPTLRAAAAAPVVAKPAVNAPVTLTDNGATWTLDNGIVKATINKKNGGLLSAIFHGIETSRPSISNGSDTLHSPPTPAGSPIPSWQQMPSGTVTASVTIDPAKNGGERAEVAVKGVNSGRMDIELRFTMERGLSGFYSYAEFSHPASYPAAQHAHPLHARPASRRGNSREGAAHPQHRHF